MRQAAARRTAWLWRGLTVLVILLLLAACGEDEPEEAQPPRDEPAGDEAAPGEPPREEPAGEPPERVPPPPPPPPVYERRSDEGEAEEEPMAEAEPLMGALAPRREEVIDLLDRFVPGEIIFRPPKYMVQGYERRIKIAIGRREVREKMLRKFNGDINDLEFAVILIGPTMKVELDGPAFFIRHITSKEQRILKNKPTVWLIGVTPLNSGKHNLRLLASLSIEGTPRDEVVYEKDINVQVNLAYIGTRFFDEHSAVIVSALVASLLGGIGFLIQRLWGRKRSRG